MKKLAVFAEGLTEATFLRKLIEEIAGAHDVVFETRRQVSGKLEVIETGDQTGQQRYFVLLVNCSHDEQVKSQILDQRASLIKAGYSLVIGVRDLYPSGLAELGEVERNLRYKVPTAGLSIEILLAVAEIEAWFIQEASHFTRIHPDFTHAYIQQLTGFDVGNQLADTLPQPAAFLHQIYATRGMAYRKKTSQINRTVDALDIADLYLVQSQRLPHLGRLVDVLNSFF